MKAKITADTLLVDLPCQKLNPEGFVIDNFSYVPTRTMHVFESWKGSATCPHTVEQFLQWPLTELLKFRNLGVDTVRRVDAILASVKLYRPAQYRSGLPKTDAKGRLLRLAIADLRTTEHIFKTRLIRIRQLINQYEELGDRT